MLDMLDMLEVKNLRSKWAKEANKAKASNFCVWTCLDTLRSTWNISSYWCSFRFCGSRSVGPGIWAVMA